MAYVFYNPPPVFALFRPMREREARLAVPALPAPAARAVVPSEDQGIWIRGARHSFLSERLLKSQPLCSWDSFCYPLLRTCRFKASTVKWGELIGFGRAGCVFKAHFGQEGPFAVKVFWHAVPHVFASEAPEWPFRDECINAAILDKLRWAAEGSQTGIVIFNEPEGVGGALDNLRAFSADGREYPIPPETGIIATLPCITKCHGWIKFDPDEVPSTCGPTRCCKNPLDAEVRQRHAIVYDFVPKGMVDHTIGKAQLEFFHNMGFALPKYNPSSWRQGRLVDFGDLTTAILPSFVLNDWKIHDVEEWFDVPRPKTRSALALLRRQASEQARAAAGTLSTS